MTTTTARGDYLSVILARKRREVARRHAHRSLTEQFLGASTIDPGRRERAIEALRRPAGKPPRVIAEIKFRSPSAGVLRARAHGDVRTLASAYARAGASAISVLADGGAFGGSVLDVRRATKIGPPVLFKEFVVDPLQVRFAREVGASLVLLLVRVLESSQLEELIAAIHEEGMEPVVEAANRGELERALQTRASIVGLNARDLRSFQIDKDAAMTSLAAAPADRIAVFMSGVASREDFQRIAEGRADAVLIGGSLMRASDPGAKLREILGRSH